MSEVNNETPAVIESFNAIGSALNPLSMKLASMADLGLNAVLESLQGLDGDTLTKVKAWIETVSEQAGDYRPETIYGQQMETLVEEYGVSLGDGLPEITVSQEVLVHRANQDVRLIGCKLVDLSAPRGRALETIPSPTLPYRFVKRSIELSHPELPKQNISFLKPVRGLFIPDHSLVLGAMENADGAVDHYILAGIDMSRSVCLQYFDASELYDLEQEDKDAWSARVEDDTLIIEFEHDELEDIRVEIDEYIKSHPNYALMSTVASTNDVLSILDSITAERYAEWLKQLKQ